MTPLLQHADECLYSTITQPSWDTVAEQVRGMHLSGDAERLEAGGEFAVRRGSHVLSRLVGWLMRLPRRNERANVRLTITRQGQRERWTRTIDGRRFISTQWMDTNHRLVERWGCLILRFRLSVSDGSLDYTQRTCTLAFGPVRVPWPAWLSPRVSATERPSDGGSGSHVSVSVVFPLVGRILEYSGAIRPIGDEA